MCSCFPTSLWPQRGGRCGRGPTRPGRAEVRTPLPQHSRPPLCLVPWLPVGQSGAPAVPVSTWARGAVRGASRHQPQLQVCAACPARGWPRPHTCRSRRCALRAREPRPCSPGPGPATQASAPRPARRPAVRGVLAGVWTARAILDPSTRVPVAGLRPPGPAAVDPGPATQTSAPRPARRRGWLGLEPLPLSRSGVLLGLGLASWPAVRELCPLVPPALIWRLFPGLSSTWPQQGLRSAPPSPWHRAELTQEVSCRPHPAVPGHYARPAMPSHLLGPRGTQGGYYGYLPGAHLG